MPETVLTLPPYAPHGGPDGSTIRLDFSVNSNPFGPPRELLEYLAKVEVSSYPDPSYTAPREAAANYHGVPTEHIVLGGAAELIYRLSACYLKPGRNALVATPTFGEYARAAHLHGAQVHTCNVYTESAEPDAAEPDAEALVRAVQTTRPTLVWLCQPNNPTGHAWSAAALTRVADACKTHDALFVIDAAYLELSAAPSALPEAVTLVPLTKTFGDGRTPRRLRRRAAGGCRNAPPRGPTVAGKYACRCCRPLVSFAEGRNVYQGNCTGAARASARFSDGSIRFRV